MAESREQVLSAQLGSLLAAIDYLGMDESEPKSNFETAQSLRSQIDPPLEQQPLPTPPSGD